MKREPIYIDHTEAQRKLKISRPSVDKLIDARMLSLGPAPDGKKISRQDVDSLIARMTLQLPGTNPVLRCPQNPDLLGPSLYFEPTTPERKADIQEINDHLDATNRIKLKYTAATKAIQCFTGYWEVSDENTELMVKNHGIILGTVAGWVYEAAEVKALAMTIPYRNRKVFVVRPLQGDELTPWLGYLPDNARGPRLITRGTTSQPTAP